MNTVVADHLPALRDLCRAHKVQRLWLVGSATDNTFDPATSDLDFLVEFEPHQRRGLHDVYFELAEALERLFAREIDLIELGTVENHAVLASIDESKVPLYAAA